MSRKSKKSLEDVLEIEGTYAASQQFPDIDFTRSEEIITTLNSRIKELRKENGLTQVDMAKILDITQKQYWLYEQDGYLMNILNIGIIAMFYNVSIDWLSGLCKTKKPFGDGNENSEYEVNGYSLKAVIEYRKEHKANARKANIEEIRKPDVFEIKDEK